MAVRYVLDANVFIEASRRYYAFDLIPAFWQALVDYADKGMLCSIDRFKKELARCADGWLVAYAVAHSCIVVTHEQYSSDARRSIPIPNICRAFGVQAIDTFAMLRALGVKLG